MLERDTNSAENVNLHPGADITEKVTRTVNIKTDKKLVHGKNLSAILDTLGIDGQPTAGKKDGSVTVRKKENDRIPNNKVAHEEKTELNFSGMTIQKLLCTRQGQL